jgi:type 1 glutamine amidotransferase
MVRIAVWGGAPNHPTRLQYEHLRWLSPPEWDLTYSEDLDVLRRPTLGRADILMMSGCRYSGIADAPWVQYWENPDAPQDTYEGLSAAEIVALGDWVRDGGSLFCSHVALGSFDDRDEFTELFDGRWVWGTSDHAPEPLPPFTVRPTRTSHPLVHGLEGFSTVDELYANMITPQRSEVLLEASQFGRTQPVLWVRTLGRGKIATCTLGHDGRSFESPGYGAVLLRILEWLSPAGTGSHSPASGEGPDGPD